MRQIAFDNSESRETGEQPRLDLPTGRPRVLAATLAETVPAETPGRMWIGLAIPLMPINAAR